MADSSSPALLKIFTDKGLRKVCNIYVFAFVCMYCRSSFVCPRSYWMMAGRSRSSPMADSRMHRPVSRKIIWFMLLLSQHAVQSDLYSARPARRANIDQTVKASNWDTRGVCVCCVCTRNVSLPQGYPVEKQELRFRQKVLRTTRCDAVSTTCTTETCRSC